VLRVGTGVLRVGTGVLRAATLARLTMTADRFAVEPGRGTDPTPLPGAIRGSSAQNLMNFVTEVLRVI